MDEPISAENSQGGEAQRVMEWAGDLFRENPHWVQFHAAIWGPGGALEVVFPEQPQRQAFQSSPDGRKLQRYLAELRKRQDQHRTKKPTVTVTVRVPKPIHEVLTHEAAQQGMSLHCLCLAKLVQPLVEEVAEDV